MTDETIDSAPRSLPEANLLQLISRSFCRGLPVEIPPYQRPYCWSIGDVRKLLDDFDSFRCHRVASEICSTRQFLYDLTDYYYGTVCLFRHDDRLEIIDGQQRFTSFLILISVLLKATEGLQAVCDLRAKLVDCLLKANSEDWQGSNWQPRISFAQPQTRAHIAEIFEIQAAEYARIKALSKSVLREVNQKTETPEETAPSYEVDFFRRELERMLKLFEHGVFAVKVIDNQYDAELFFQCENNRGKEMDLLDILKAYHMRIALSHNSKSMECIRQMWADVTDHGAASIYPLPEHKTVVLTLLLIRFGVEYWRHWDKMNVNRLKGVIGTYSGTSVGDKKLRKQSSTVIDEIQQSEFLPDLMSPIHPGIDFFRTFNYYLRIVKALEESRIFNGSECLFDNCVHLGLQAAVCWLDRFAEVHPNLDKPFAEDVADLSTAYKSNVELLIYIQAYWRIFRRLRKTVKVKIGNGNEETINCVFGRFSGPKQIAFFQLGNPNDNLLTLPYRTNSPAECRREFERLTSPGVIDSWRILWRKDKYARYVCYEAAAELMSQNGVNHD